MKKIEKDLRVTIIYKGVLQPSGGPAGYLYNLENSIKTNNINTINIVSIPKHDKTLRKDLSQKLKNKMKQIIKIPNFLIEKKRKEFYRHLLNEHREMIRQSTILHFHTTQDLYYFAKVYDLSQHIILLMSHSPEIPYEEIESLFLSIGYSRFRARQEARIQKKIDVFAFKKANFIVFPCAGATEAYVEFLKSQSISLKRCRYILTSSSPLIPKLSRDEFRSSYGISDDKKIICFVGRKTQVKGFDIFCSLVKKFKNNNNFFFISAGKGDIATPQQVNFIDIGWTDDPASVINAADILVVPNRSTYFDLGIIQALSLNKTIITTKTGGNNWFSNKDANVYFADENDIDTFQKILESCEPYLKNKKNIELYQKFFTNKKFALEYEKFYQSIS